MNLGDNLVVNTRFVFTILFCVSLAGCDTPRVTPFSGQVKGVSMTPGLRDGEAISWLPAQVDDYQRYVPVVCKHEDDLVTKRIIGLAGESIRIADGELVKDGEILRKTPRLLQQFGLIVDRKTDSWRDATQSWRQVNNTWVCEHVSPKHTAWLTFHPESSTGVVPAIDGVRIYDDVSWLSKETRRLNIVQDVGISVVLDIDLDEECGLEIVVGKNQYMARLVVRKQGRLAVIAGRLDGQFVVTAWPIPQSHREYLESQSAVGVSLAYDVPKEWSVESEVAHEDHQPRDVASLGLGIKLLTEREEVSAKEICTVTAEKLLVWRDTQWLATPNKSEWSVPVGHVFVLGDCPAASRDSRHWGPLPIDAIQGTVLQPSPGESIPFRLHQD